jgi:hypothetical protein
MKHTLARALTTAFVLTATATGFAGVAYADPPPFNGTYAGGDDENVWIVSTNCATNGCTGTVASNQGWSVPATMTNNVWNFVVTKPDGVICTDGSYAPAYISLSVDPVTLKGIVTLDDNYSCPGGNITQTPFQLTKVG